MSQTTVAAIIPDSARNAPKPSMRKLAVHGTAWTIAGYGASQILRLGSNLILTRLLAPSIFGVMALVQVFLQGLVMFSDVGVGPSVIKYSGEDPVFLNTAWTIQFVRGWLLWFVCIALAEPVARFYQVPELRWLIVVAGLDAVIDGCRSLSLLTENKKLALKGLTIVNVATQVISIIVTIGLVYFTRSVWGLVIGALFSAFCMMISSYLFFPSIQHRLCWNKTARKELFHFGKWIFISTICSFIAAQLDRVMLGKLVSLSVLGIYSIAMTLSTVPKIVISQISVAVAFPVYAHYAKKNINEYAEKVLASRQLILPMATVIIAGIVTISPPFFHYLYDRRYADAGWMSQLLAIYIWFWLLSSSVGPVLLAIGRSRPVSIGASVNTVVTAIGCLVGYHLAGMHGFILGLSFSSLCGHVVLEIALYMHGINIIIQDVLFTVWTTLLVISSLAIGYGVKLIVPSEYKYPVGMLVPNLVVLVVAIWVGKRLYERLRSGKSLVTA